MPIFDFKCPECSNIKSNVYVPPGYSSVKGIEPNRCPACNYELNDEDKTIGSFSFTLKGKGWAKDNYSSED